MTAIGRVGLAGLVGLFVLPSCAGAPAREAGPNAKPAPLGQSASRVREAKATIECVVIPVAWVEKTMPVTAADVQTWAAVRDNAMRIETASWAIFVTGDATTAKKKMDARVARLAKEDIEKVVAENDKVGTATDVVKVGETLAPGETSKPVPIDGGLLVVKKEPAREDDAERAFRKARAPELAKKLGDEISAKLKANDSLRSAIADGVLTVLGEGAVADAARPQVVTVDDGRIDSLRVPSAAKDELRSFVRRAQPGQVLDPAITAGTVFVVARGLTPTP